MYKKKGKTPGKVHSISYNKAYDSVETIELSGDFKDKNIVLIDDGIASGGTTNALFDLVKKTGGNVISICVAVKHTYTVCTFDKCPVYSVFDL